MRNNCNLESPLEPDTNSIPVCPVVPAAPLSIGVRDLAFQLDAVITESYSLAKRLELLKQPAANRSVVRQAISLIALLQELPLREMALGSPISSPASRPATGFKAHPGNEQQLQAVANTFDAVYKILSRK